MNNNDSKVLLPNDFEQVKSVPEDPVNSVPYMKQTQSSSCFVIVYPMNNPMPYDNNAIIINGIHHSLANDQGLIEVKSGLTASNKKYAYSIVKTAKKPSGIQYCLFFQINNGINDICIKGFFDEVGITGVRDTTIMSMLLNKHEISLPNMDGWFKDPYNPEYKNGLLMNISEREEYDSFFPNHPLSELRNFIKYVVSNN